MTDSPQEEESTEAETEPDDQPEPRYPWMSCDATNDGQLAIKWGWVRSGEWSTVMGDATVGYGNADQVLAVAVNWWQNRWQDIVAARRQRRQQAADSSESSA